MIQKIVLYYKYVYLQNPAAIQAWQRSLCESLGLKGRILIAQEGINATAGGTSEAVDAYIQAMQQHELFAYVDYKTSMAQGDCFPKLKIKVRPTIVNMGIDPHAVSPEQGGIHVTPTQAHELMNKKDENLVILDARNEFEARIGKFEGALVPDIEYFREFPAYVDNNLEQFKDKEVLMYCTGGIRCERASAYLKSKNIAKNVYQIEGGIHRYVEQFPEGHFRGKNYVFDGRVAVTVNNDVLGSCLSCGVSCNEFHNCANVTCNAHCLYAAHALKHSKVHAVHQCLEKIKNNIHPARVIPAKTACSL